MEEPRPLKSDSEKREIARMAFEAVYQDKLDETYNIPLDDLAYGFDGKVDMRFLK